MVTWSLIPSIKTEGRPQPFQGSGSVAAQRIAASSVARYEGQPEARS